MFNCDWSKVWEASAPVLLKNLQPVLQISVLQIKVQNSVNGQGLIVSFILPIIQNIPSNVGYFSKIAENFTTTLNAQLV